jgi:hypothetical protein
VDWYYAKQGRQEGPVGAEALRAKLVSGELARTDLVWREGMEKWTAAEEVPELSAPPPGAGISAQLPQPPAGIPPSMGMMGPVAPTSGLAIASLVCGLVGLFLSIACIGIFCGLPAVICGHAALNTMRASPIPVAGKGMAITGLVTGYLSCLSTGWLIFFFFVL